jgi:transcriptional regulator with XRE-family HTH domain
LSTSLQRRPRRAVISGHLVQLARASAGLSQEDLADDLGVSRGSVQSWEAGRRPISAVAHGAAVELHQRLLYLGADPGIVDLLTPAAEADTLLDAVLDQPAVTVDLDRHPLGWTVLRQDVAELVLWAAVGQTPLAAAQLPVVPKFGPQTDRPELDPGDTIAAVEALRILAERARGRSVLLHRQAVFLASAAPGAADVAWRPEPATLDHFRKPVGWTPHWAGARSLAIAAARAGDPEQLRAFIAHADDAWETANLRYWAYWCGDDHRRQASDAFMTGPARSRWRGSRLYAHLARRLDPESTRTELNVHTLWSLLIARPSLAAGDPDATERILTRAVPLLDSGVLSPKVERELRSVTYALTVINNMSKEQSL